MLTIIRQIPRNLLFLAILLAACGGGAEPTDPTPPPPAAVASVTVSLASAGLVPGGTTQASALLRSSAGATLTGRTITWNSSATGVATVSTTGLVTAVSEGSATITATSEGQSGGAQLTVAPPPVATVTVTLSAGTVTAGSTPQATAVLRDAGGAELAGRTVTWSSSEVGVATVVPGTGAITAVAPGTTTITATSEGRNGTAVLTVTAVPVATVTVSLSAGTVATGSTPQATAVLRDAAGGVLTGRTITWSSSEVGVATVVPGTGAITAVAPGTTTITATSEGQSGAAVLTVTAAPVATVTVTLSASSVAAGSAAQASAVLRDAGGAVLTGRTVTWSSSQVAVATVVPGTGAVTAVAPGTTIITATSEGQSGTSVLTVTAAPVAAITFPADSIGLAFRASSQLVPTLRDAAGNVLTGRTITWQTSDATLASVSAAGLVRSLLPGTVTVTATSEGQSATVRVTGTLANLSTIVDSIRQAHGMPAMGAALVHREGLLGLGAGGTRRITDGVLATVDDKWHLGSNTKALTGILAGMAVEAGVLSWDRTVAQAFPDLTATTLPAYTAVPLFELFSHTGGLTNTTAGLTHAGTPSSARLAWATTTFSTTPQNARGVYFYSNSAYGAIASMIERAWGSTYEALMTARIYQPLGITDAGWGRTTNGGGDHPMGHSLVGANWVLDDFEYAPGFSAAGNAHISLRSWARIIQELMLADQGRSTLLTQTTARYLTSNVVPPSGGHRYGIGWQVPTGARQVWHDGSNNRNHARAWLFLDTGVAYLMTVNAADLVTGRTGAAMSALQTRLTAYYNTGQ